MKVNIGKLLKHLKLFLLPLNVKISVSIDILKLHSFFPLQNPSILLSHLRMKEISWKQHNWGVRWEGSLNKFQFDHLLDLSDYLLYFTTEFCGKWREKSPLDVYYAPIVYYYIRDHLKSQWLKMIIID